MPSQDEISQWLVNEIVEIVVIDEGDIDISASFSSYGLSSKDAISLSGDLEDWLDRRLSPTLVYEYPSIEALSEFLSKDGASDKTEEETSEEIIADKDADSSAAISSSTSVEMIEEMTDEEAEEQLIEKLNSIGQE